MAKQLFNRFLGWFNFVRIKLDSTKTRLIYIEEIFIGERIRDLVYDYLNKKILLALESSGSIGILSVD